MCVVVYMYTCIKREREKNTERIEKQAREVVSEKPQERQWRDSVWVVRRIIT